MGCCSTTMLLTNSSKGKFSNRRALGSMSGHHFMERGTEGDNMNGFEYIQTRSPKDFLYGFKGMGTKSEDLCTRATPIRELFPQYNLTDRMTQLIDHENYIILSWPRNSSFNKGSRVRVYYNKIYWLNSYSHQENAELIEKWNAF